LAFHRYPQLIRAFFNTQRFGPPRGISRASPWSWIGHLVSGLQHATVAPYSDSVSLRLRDSPLNLATYRNSPVRYAKSTRSPGPTEVDHRAPTDCKHTISGSISLPSRGSFHLSLTVLVRYRSLEVLSLRRWSSRIRAGFHVSRTTWERAGLRRRVSLTGLLPAMAHLSRVFQLRAASTLCLCGGRWLFPQHPTRNAHKLEHV
jgi:hypothetical protein